MEDMDNFAWFLEDSKVKSADSLHFLKDLTHSRVWADLCQHFVWRHCYAYGSVAYWPVLINLDDTEKVESWIERDEKHIARWRDEASRRRYRRKML